MSFPTSASTSGCRHFAPAEAIRCVIILWACVPAIHTLLNHGLQDGSYDAAIHLYRLLDLDQTFRAGTLRPWIAPHLALDYGYATFTYYPPLGVYLGEILHLLGPGYIAALKATFVLSVLASALGAYLLGRDLFGWRAGLAASIIYVYVPYHLIDIYLRGDLAESLALAVLPFVFWSLPRAARHPRGGTVAVAGAFLGALVLAHNITTLVTAPILLVYLLVTSFRALNRSAVAAVVFAGLLGFALSATYWLPVLTQLGQVDTTALTTGQFDYHNEFIPLPVLIQGHWAYNYQLLRDAGDWFNVGRVQILLAVVSAFWVIIARPARSGVLIFAAATIAFLLWMQQPGSVFVWDHLPFTRFIQFPSRLSVYIGLMSSLLISAFVAQAGPGSLASGQGPRGRRAVYVVGAGLEVAAVGAFLAASLWLFHPRNATLQGFEVNLPTVWRRENGSGLIAGNTQGDYLPSAVHGTFFQNASLLSPREHASTPVRVTAVWSSPLNFRAATDASAPASVLFDRLYYPGWEVAIDGHSVSLEVDGTRGTIRVAVPAGHHELQLVDAGTTFERLGEAVSLVAILVVLGIIVRPRRPGWSLRLALVVTAAALAGSGLATQVRPPRQLIGGVDFGHSVRLVGSRLDRVPGTQPGVIDVTLIWEALESPLPDCSVSLQLIDDNGHVVATRDKAPLFGLRPCTQWRAGEIIRDHQQIRLPPGVVPGRYRLGLGFILGGQVLTPSTERVDSTSKHVLLGTVDASSPPAAVRLPDSMSVGATVGSYFALDAARILRRGPDGMTSLPPSDSRFVARLDPNDRIEVDLLWRATADAPADYAVFVQLLDASQKRVAQHDSWPDQENYPTTTWFPGDTVIDRHPLDQLTALHPGLYTLVAGMYSRSDFVRLATHGHMAGENTITLGTVKVVGPDQTFGHPSVLAPHGDVFGNQIALAGSAVHPTDSSRGTPVTVDLAWRAIERPGADYTVFVHVLDQTGHLVAQHDARPLAGAYPTVAWDPGDTIYDSVVVPIPPQLPAGTYHVEVGLYELKTGARLVTTGGASALPVGTLSVH